MGALAVLLALGVGVPGVLARGAGHTVSARAAKTIRIVRKNKLFVPSHATVKDGDVVEFCNEDPFYEFEFSYSHYNKFGNERATPTSSQKGLYEASGTCKGVTIHNPTQEPIHALIFDEAHSSGKLTLWVLPAGEYKGTTTTPATTTTTTAPSTPTKVTLTAGGDVCTTYLLAEDGFNAGDQHCSGGYETSSNWYFKVSKDATVTLTISIDVALPPHTGLQINGSPTPLCRITSGETCTATIGPYPTLTAPQAIDVSGAYTTAYGGSGPALALVFSP